MQHLAVIQLAEVARARIAGLAAADTRPVGHVPNGTEFPSRQTMTRFVEYRALAGILVVRVTHGAVKLEVLGESHILENRYVNFAVGLPDIHLASK